MSDEKKPNTFTPTVELPDEAMFVSAITVVMYLDEEGNSMFRIGRSGSGTFLQNIGMLESAKYALHQENDKRTKE